MYKNGCIAAIKDNDGKITKEIPVGPGQKKDIILPFNTEFSVFLRNKTSNRVGVEVLVDGKNVLRNAKVIILERGDIFDVEGFEDGGRFLFLDVNSNVAQELGRQEGFYENGLVEVKFYNLVERPWGWYQLTNERYYKGQPPQIIYTSGNMKMVDQSEYDSYSTSDMKLYSKNSEPNMTKSYTPSNFMSSTITRSNQYYTSAVTETTKEGVIEEGSAHDQEYNFSAKYSVGSLITSFVFKMNGFDSRNKRKIGNPKQAFVICTHCGERVVNGNFCQFCGNELS